MSTTLTKRGVFVAEVVSNHAICENHYDLRLRLASFPPTRPGQFVQVQCRPPTDQVSHCATDWPEGGRLHLSQPELTGKEPLLRRPLSLAGRRDVDGGVELRLIYRAVGAGTHYLAGLKPQASPGQYCKNGDASPFSIRGGTCCGGLAENREVSPFLPVPLVSILGPLGNGFTIFPDRPAAVLIGGGVGVPPMIYLAQALAAAGKKVVAFCGARTAGMIPLTPHRDRVSAAGEPSLCAGEFAEIGVPAVLATDDGSLGFSGTIAEALDRWLKTAACADKDLAVYSCGPELMMQAVADIALAGGYACELALERHMACGMGTCQSCIVKIRDATPRGWSFKLCCTDGPVFNAEQIVW